MATQFVEVSFEWRKTIAVMGADDDEEAIQMARVRAHEMLAEEMEEGIPSASEFEAFIE